METKAAMPVHHTAVVDEPWDGPAAVAAMPDNAATLRYCHAWMDSSGDDTAKGTYKFPHHKTKGGPANLAACRNGLARLDGASIPSGDVAGVRAHLQAHLDDAKKSAERTSMETKSLNRVEIKDAAKGEVDVVFATLDVIDSDGDVTVPGAFQEGAEVVISAYGHTSWQGALPVGKGQIRTVGDEAIMSGQFFMDTTVGRDTFAVVKELGSLQQWSYGFDVTESAFGEKDDQNVRFLKGLEVYEVSPTLLGAGVNTRVLSAKSGAPATFLGEASAVLAAVTALADRAADVMAKRREKGKGLGTDSAAVLDQIVAQCTRLTGAVDEPDNSEELQTAFQREFLRSIRRSA